MAHLQRVPIECFGRREVERPKTAEIAANWRARRARGSSYHIPETTWRRYIALREERSSRRAGIYTYLLSGLLTCSICGGRLYGFTSRYPQGGAYSGYRCENSKPGHGKSNISVRYVDPAFLKWLRERPEADDTEPPAPPTDDRLEAERVAREISDLDAKTLNLTLQFAEEKIPERAYLAATEHYADRRATLERTLKSIESAIVLTPEAPDVDAAALLAEWDTATLDTKHAAIQALVSRMTVHMDKPKRMVIEPRGGRPVTVLL
ncbi:zinc ribbon domain-containing protein [Agromyces atrinae]|uniref:zinc ribbon domain-containing protein n=1 Tax=Agromyces atrinae TaxID=592376 RepID=UPI001F59EE55|nr:zinc ribbon domain-containing protein [Agromyces atrinae]MCI2956931.1 zinc ribbon domain-containing protein [Agromyces atrinae]